METTAEGNYIIWYFTKIIIETNSETNNLTNKLIVLTTTTKQNKHIDTTIGI